MTDLTDQVLSAWLSGAVPDAEIAEALRVAYVGVTRAQRLLGLAAPAPYRDRISAFLRHHGVPTELR